MKRDDIMKLTSSLVVGAPAMPSAASGSGEFGGGV